MVSFLVLDSHCYTGRILTDIEISEIQDVAVVWKFACCTIWQQKALIINSEFNILLELDLCSFENWICVSV